jgi:hypothetical protein
VPRVSGIRPDNKDAGYSSFTATITGENFQSASHARIGATGLTDEVVGSSASMTASVPAGISEGSHDVSFSNIYFDWGTGSALFAVNTPTPTRTPTATPTPTATATPTPWDAASCSAKGGYWASINDGTGANGCWFDSVIDASCDAICGQHAPLTCDKNRNWNGDPDCNLHRHFGGICGQCLAYSNACPSWEPGGTAHMCGNRPAEVPIDSAYCARPAPNPGYSYRRMCVCSPP